MATKLKTVGFFLLLGMAFWISSCMDESGFNIVWEGREVEFDDASRPNNSIQKIMTKTNDNQVDQEFVRVNLVGAQVDQPVPVLLGVDPTSTAVEGVHYRLEDREVTIPANSSFVDVPLEILTGNLATDEMPDLTLTILDAGETKISTNYFQLTIEIRLSCPSDLEGVYNTVTVGTGGTVNYEVTITELEPFTYRISDITGGVYSQVFGAEDNPAVFTELCGEITITDQPDLVFGEDTFNGTGSVNEDGTIRISWRTEESEESGVTTLTRVVE
ncbi:DUF4843 domain-containing protein [Cyclobacterium jeungdonense]|uniref:DUF4843 domain-containing protein n=1 Tax=Cyclobacterium jeungdonense TaxID=708087 RepID=A0ABT8C6S7_9BACT|nr:DUF4843 domain-containing protein [Cyclobacterium jeungdonense]MDN3688220.1 DUF4843 domain-containing protein [Cyclobacterium jeungdonense]